MVMHVHVIEGIEILSFNLLRESNFPMEDKKLSLSQIVHSNTVSFILHAMHKRYAVTNLGKGEKQSQVAMDAIFLFKFSKRIKKIP